MFDAILAVLMIAVVGSLTVPLIMLLLAQLGYFEPIEFEAFGKRWHFAPRGPALTRL